MKIIEASTVEIGELFGVGPRTIGVWRRRGLPCIRPGRRNKPGEWDLAAVLAWWRENVAFAVDADADASTRAEAERRRAWARAQREELALAIDRGEYAPIEDIVRIVRRSDTTAIALWEQSPDRLVALLPPKTTAKDRRRFLKGARAIVADVIEAQRQGLIDLEREYIKETEEE